MVTQTDVRLSTQKAGADLHVWILLEPVRNKLTWLWEY